MVGSDFRGWPLLGAFALGVPLGAWGFGSPSAGLSALGGVALQLSTTTIEHFFYG